MSSESLLPRVPLHLNPAVQPVAFAEERHEVSLAFEEEDFEEHSHIEPWKPDDKVGPRRGGGGAARHRPRRSHAPHACPPPQVRTSTVALVTCLNIGTDPPDANRYSPCAREECWIGSWPLWRRRCPAGRGADPSARTDPSGMSPTKALDDIGTALHAQYQRWESKSKVRARRPETGYAWIGPGARRCDANALLPSLNAGAAPPQGRSSKTRYKLALDPTADQVQRLCSHLRRHAKVSEAAPGQRPLCVRAAPVRAGWRLPRAPLCPPCRADPCFVPDAPCDRGTGSYSTTTATACLGRRRALRFGRSTRHGAGPLSPAGSGPPPADATPFPLADVYAVPAHIHLRPAGVAGPTHGVRVRLPLGGPPPSAPG